MRMACRSGCRCANRYSGGDGEYQSTGAGSLTISFQKTSCSPINKDADKLEICVFVCTFAASLKKEVNMELSLDLSKRYTYAEYLTWLDGQARELIGGFIKSKEPCMNGKEKSPSIFLMTIR